MYRPDSLIDQVAIEKFGIGQQLPYKVSEGTRETPATAKQSSHSHELLRHGELAYCRIAVDENDYTRHVGSTALE